MAINTHHNQSGFALLITLLVIGVVVAIGLSILELTQKQVRLASNSADSEAAFHATNAGAECARYWRRVERAEFEVGNTVSADCFNESANFTPAGSTGLPASPPASGSADVYRYNATFDWDSADERCSDVDMLVMVVSPTASGPLVVGSAADPVSGEFPGYTDEAGETKTCEPGGKCTLISVRGYNKACSETTSFGTVQREVLLQF